LHNQVKHGCSKNLPTQKIEDSVDKQHGRIEKRKYEMFSASTIIDKSFDEWPYLKKIIKVTRYREEIGQNPSEEVSFYISNGNLELKEFAKCIREHWFIENKSNYVRDVTMREDFTVKRVNPFAFATILSLALNILRSKNVKNINEAIEKNAMDFEKVLKTYVHLFDTTKQ
jgi:predicted transposase YbfD/YdcC